MDDFACEVGVSSNSIDFRSLSVNAIEISFSLCGIALVTSLGVAVVIKLLKNL